MENNSIKKKKNVVKGIVIAAISLGIVGAAFAYFTAQTKQKVNEFNILGDGGDIVIKEPEWDPENAKKLTPGSIVKKDPYTLSTMDYDGWVVMRVEVPQIYARLEGDKDYKLYDVFDLLKEDGKTPITPGKIGEEANPNFILLAVEKSTTEKGNPSTVYFYGYTGGEPNEYGTKGLVLSKEHAVDEKVDGNKTTRVFNHIRVKKFAFIQDVLNDTISVDAQIIQRIDHKTGHDFKDVTDAFKEMGEFSRSNVKGPVVD